MSQKAFKSPADLAKKVDEYFAKCKASKQARELKSGDVRIRQELPSFVGLAVHLGVATGNSDNTADNGAADIQSYSTVLARAHDRIELETLNAVSNGDTDSRITLARLAKFGYSTKVETESKAELTVKWEGVDTSDIREWGK